jgi:hypothetical protein
MLGGLAGPCKAASGPVFILWGGRGARNPFAAPCGRWGPPVKPCRHCPSGGPLPRGGKPSCARALAPLEPAASRDGQGDTCQAHRCAGGDAGRRGSQGRNSPRGIAPAAFRLRGAAPRSKVPGLSAPARPPAAPACGYCGTSLRVRAWAEPAGRRLCPRSVVMRRDHVAWAAPDLLPSCNPHRGHATAPLEGRFVYRVTRAPRIPVDPGTKMVNNRAGSAILPDCPVVPFSSGRRP